jgi:hypothetical protein
VIIFGYRRFARLLAMTSLVCALCHNRAAQRLVVRTTMFTLFFVPLIPLGRSRTMTCTHCGRSTRLSKAQADAAIAVGTAPGQPVAPPAPQQQLPDWMPFPTGEATGR